MADKKISDMTTAGQVNDSDNVELSQGSGSSFVSVKASILAIATKMLTAINFTSSLQTTDKTVIGAINEVAQGGGGGGDSVSWTQITQSGTKIAEIDINGTSTNVYAPSGGGGGGDTVSWTQITLTGTKIAEIDINGTPTDVYIPNTELWTDVTGTLTTGSTSITLSDASITTTSTIEVFNDLDVPYNSKTLSTGSITLTFDAQESNMSVKVRVS